MKPEPYKISSTLSDTLFCLPSPCPPHVHFYCQRLKLIVDKELLRLGDNQIPYSWFVECRKLYFAFYWPCQGCAKIALKACMPGFSVSPILNSTRKRLNYEGLMKPA